MNRIDEERNYWNNNALDEDVDIKYICDIDTKLCKKDLTGMSGEVLEIGCGVGRLLEPGWWGIDISQNMLNIANKRKPECGYRHTDGRNIPFEDDYFDSVYCYLVFQHLKPDAVENYINEAYRVLKKGGTFIFQFINGTEREQFSNHYSISEINEFTKKFNGASFHKSKAYDGWLIAKCKK